MDKQELIALAERVEKLEGPDRSLDWSIHLRNGLEGVGAYGQHPHYTASIDAAMTLVPEGDGIGFQVGHGAGMQANAGVWAVSTNSADLLDKDFPCPMWQASSSAATPALALCAATLRAIASQEGE